MTLCRPAEVIRHSISWVRSGYSLQELSVRGYSFAPNVVVKAAEQNPHPRSLLLSKQRIEAGNWRYITLQERICYTAVFCWFCCTH